MRLGVFIIPQQTENQQLINSK